MVLSWIYRSTCSRVERTWGANSRCQYVWTWPLWRRLHHGFGWYQQRWKNRPTHRGEGMMTDLCYRDDILEVYVRPYAGAIGTSSSSWTTTLDFIVPGWLRSTSSRRPSSAGIGQHAHTISHDRLCLEHGTGGDFATSSPTNDYRGTWKCSNWRVEQSWNDIHPETKHETALPGCDCLMWVTHKLLTVVVSGIWTVLEIFITWSNIVKPLFWGYDSLMT